jgi:hypothetical protein
MGFLEDILPQNEPDTNEPVELVVLPPEQLYRGVVMGNPLPFADKHSAVHYAKENLSNDDRGSCWIRHGDVVQPLSEAEAEVAGGSSKSSSEDQEQATEIATSIGPSARAG